MRLFNSIKFIALVATLNFVVCGQTNSVLIDASRPSVYVSYERRGRITPLLKGESDERIWLKFHNNTRIPVFLCKGEVPIDYGDALLPRNVYQSGTMRTIQLTALGYETTDVCNVLEVRSGTAIIFSVPSEELNLGRLIEVEYYYGWTSDWQQDISNGTKSLVRFGADQIPKQK